MSENSADEILLFFTSNARPLYRRDLLNVCTEPENSHIRFGYDKDWISEDDKPKLKVGASVLIVYCELKTTAESVKNHPEVSGNLEFYPIRKAEIIAVKVVNESRLVDLRLKEFFKPFQEKAKLEEQKTLFQKHVLSLEGNPDTEDKDARRYVLTGKSDSTGDFSADCLPLINYVKKLNGLSDCYFICGLKPGTTLKGEVTPEIETDAQVSILPQYCIPEHTYENEKSVHTLKAGKDYRVRLIVIAGKDAPPDQVPKLSIEETIPTVNVLGPFVKQHPFGFRTDFIIRCKNSLAEEWGAFFIKAKDADAKAKETNASGGIESSAQSSAHKSSEIYGLIKVKRDRWFIGIFILVPLSIFFTFTGPDFTREFVDYSFNRFLCQYICLSPTNVGIVFKFLGVALSLGASYLLTSKISFK